MTRRIDTLVLLALPASGKSELRRYLASVDAERSLSDFGLGPTVDLDDYPYVHLMRRIDEELEDMDSGRIFYQAADRPFRDGRDWATLLRLVNEDYAALGSRQRVPDAPTDWLMDRLRDARALSGMEGNLRDPSAPVSRELAARLDGEVAQFAEERSRTLSMYEPDRSTVVVEFARGGPAGATPPLAPPHGYGYALAVLAKELLQRAAILYVWVTPEESQRRNRERAVPGREGDASILHHGVPEVVMREDYGTDDFLWLLERSGGNAVDVEKSADGVRVPAAVFDNRIDQTSFLRNDPDEWSSDAVSHLHSELARALSSLW